MALSRVTSPLYGKPDIEPTSPMTESTAADMPRIESLAAPRSFAVLFQRTYEIEAIPLSYAEHWAALAAQIKSLQRAGELYRLFQSYHTEDTYAAGTFLREESGALVQSLEQFRHDFAGSLPSAAIARIDHFLGARIVQAAKDAKAEQIGAARGAFGSF
jgi:hypothetical protein